MFNVQVQSIIQIQNTDDVSSTSNSNTSVNTGANNYSNIARKDKHSTQYLAGDYACDYNTQIYNNHAIISRHTTEPTHCTVH